MNKIYGYVDPLIMKKVLTYIAVLVMLAVVFFVASYFYVVDMHWIQISKSISPDTTLVIHEYNYASDGDSHAPYGTYLFLNSSFNLIIPRSGHIIFAGYCQEPFSYSWLNQDHININCKTIKTKDIRTLSSRAYGAKISVN